MTEAYQTVDGLEDRSRTKRKNRTVVVGSFADLPEEFEDNKPKKGKNASIGKLSEKEETILKVAELVGVDCQTQKGAGTQQWQFRFMWDDLV